MAVQQHDRRTAPPGAHPQDDEVAIRLDAVVVFFDSTTDSSRPMTDEERAYWGRWLVA